MPVLLQPSTEIDVNFLLPSAAINENHNMPLLIYKMPPYEWMHGVMLNIFINI